MGRPAKYPAEFRRDAVAMVLEEGRSILDVAKSLGLPRSTLGKWVDAVREERGEFSGEERAELSLLRDENKQLRMERDLLKRSLAFWVNEKSTP